MPLQVEERLIRNYRMTTQRPLDLLQDRTMALYRLPGLPQRRDTTTMRRQVVRLRATEVITPRRRALRHHINKAVTMLPLPDLHQQQAMTGPLPRQGHLQLRESRNMTGKRRFQTPLSSRLLRPSLAGSTDPRRATLPRRKPLLVRTGAKSTPSRGPWCSTDLDWRLCRPPIFA